MKHCLFIFLVLPVFTFAQLKNNEPGLSFRGKETYLSFNLLSVTEPQLALGPSFGIRFTERSETFAEVAYIGKSPFYRNDWKDFSYLHGARFILQYRYHFLQQWRPLINFGGASHRKKVNERQQPFIGIEFRYKPYRFSSKDNFINEATHDTLFNVPFTAQTNVLGGALIFGRTFNLSSDNRWKLELTAGIGGKQRLVKFKIPASGYKLYRDFIPKDGPIIPKLQEETGTVYFPFAMRLRYTFN